MLSIASLKTKVRERRVCPCVYVSTGLEGDSTISRHTCPYIKCPYLRPKRLVHQLLGRGHHIL